MLGIYLKTWRFPDGVYTTLARGRVIEQLTAAAGRRPGAKKRATRASTKRQSSVEAEIDVIRTSIRRKTTPPPAKRLPTRIARKPQWDSRRGNLWFGDNLCKHFHQPGQDERLVLAVFEKEGWPGQIHDPLPSKPDADDRQRLADTARRLNEQNPFLP